LQKKPQMTTSEPLTHSTNSTNKTNLFTLKVHVTLWRWRCFRKVQKLDAAASFLL